MAVSVRFSRAHGGSPTVVQRTCAEKGYATADILTEVFKYVIRVGFPPLIYADILSKLADIEYRLAFATSEKLQLASIVSAFVFARARVGLEAPVGSDA